jgi:hypothetical protein
MPHYLGTGTRTCAFANEWVVFDWWSEFVLWREWRKGVVKLELLAPEWQNRIRYLDTKLAAIRAKQTQKCPLA